MATHEWVKEALQVRGYMQRDLATSWGISEGAVSRWISGQERPDLPMSRAIALASMLDISLDDLAARLGFKGNNKPEPSTLPGPIGIAPGTINFTPVGGKVKVLLNVTLEAKAAGDLLITLTAAQATAA